MLSSGPIRTTPYTMRLPSQRLRTKAHSSSSENGIEAKSLEAGTVTSSASWSVYCLLSADFRRTYVGVTSDVSRRIRQHNGEISGGAKACRSGRPWKIICTVQGFSTYSEAGKFEWEWKNNTKKTHSKPPPVPDALVQRALLRESPLVLKRKLALERVMNLNDWQCLDVEWHEAHVDI